MSNEHHQAGRRPDKAELERDHPEHRERKPLGQIDDRERHGRPGEKGEHTGLSNLEELKRLEAEA